MSKMLMEQACKMSSQQGFKLASEAWHALSGMFAVYKPSGITQQRVKHIIQTTLLQELNSLQQKPQKTLVKLVPATDSRLAIASSGTLKALEVPSFADHPLVRGPAYKDIRLSVVSTGMDRKACGVMVLAIRGGNELLDRYQAARLPRHYTVRGHFGVATDTHDGEGKIWQKTTYDHITLEMLDQITSRIHRSYQRELIRHSGVDIQSQEAYELAVRGLLHPVGKTNPLLTDINCTMFEPPDFELEIVSYADTSQYLRKLVHDIGQQLKSSAVALQVRRTGDGPFTVEHALLKKRWKLDCVAEALEQSRPFIKASNLEPISLGKEAVQVMQDVDERLELLRRD